MEDIDVSIMSATTAAALNLLRVGPPPEMVNTMLEPHDKLNALLRRYDDLFKGLGQLKDVQVKVQVEESVTPVAQPPRRLPILLQNKVDSEIDKLLELKVLEKAVKPPTWVNPLHVVQKKNGDIQLCVDMKVANTSIIREPYQIPTLEEFRHEFNQCKYFTTLDLNQSYH